MQVLLRAIYHLSAMRGDSTARVAIVVDGETGICADAVVALLHPWRSWLEIADVLVTDTNPGDGWLDMICAGGVTTVSVVSERTEFATALQSAVQGHGLDALGSDYPTDGGRTSALFAEMAHHHYELGGVNEWDGATVQFAPQVLKHISAANCIAYFPQYILDELRASRQTLGRPLEALDVGSGPISRLRWGAVQGLLHVIGVDPLIDIYDVIMRYHGLDRLPAIRVDRAINANAEDLDSHVAAGSIDFAFCCNALDHVEDPPAVIAQLAHALRPGALFALEFATREGSRQSWQQLHQFDLFVNAEQTEIMCQWHDGRVDALVPRDAPLVLDRIVMTADDYTVAVLRHDELTSCLRHEAAESLSARELPPLRNYITGLLKKAPRSHW
ncbi:MAG: methyltransferase domain-containing protein [Solirubrobacteraceae bacterium]